MPRRLQWDIFCKVIDNFGDIGVCWRLAADLAGRGHRVRLWLDDASALAWMAPGGCDGVAVLQWAEPLDLAPARLRAQPSDVLVEAFGCTVAIDFIAACARTDWASGQKLLWINLEYLSAEPYVQRSHGLPSPVRHGPAAGATKWFFYPGFTEGTGGLLREPSVAARQAGFDADSWLAGRGLVPDSDRREKYISLFCYEPPLLPALLAQLARNGLHGEPVRLLVTAGRANAFVQAILDKDRNLRALCESRRWLSISYLDVLTQTDFDHLLWACDLNFVRGEDSLVRALWAGRPVVWQAYPQSDGAHQPKVEAFLDMLQAPPSLRRFHQGWNGAAAMLPVLDLESWLRCALDAKARLAAQDDLTTQLLAFVASKLAQEARP